MTSPVHEAEVRPERELEVESGHDDDLCPLCGIKRRFAGYTILTCADHAHEPGCFVRE